MIELQQEMAIKNEKKIDISTISFFLISFFMCWIPFEWTFFRFSFINSLSIIQLLRNTVDFIPMLLLLFLFLSGAILPKEFFYILLAYVIIFFLNSLSLIIERKSLFQLTSFFGVVFRFVPFVFFSFRLSHKHVSKLLLNLRYLTFLMIFIGIFSLLNHQLTVFLFLPSPDIFLPNVPTAYLIDDELSGTFITTIEYAYWLLFLSSITILREKNIFVKGILFLITFFLIFKTGSLATLICLIVMFYCLFTKPVTQIASIAGFFLLIFSLGTILKTTIGQADLVEYASLSSESNRLGFVSYMMPEFLSNASLKDLLLGCSVDVDSLNKRLMSLSNLPSILLINMEDNLKLVKDVYWVSILLNQGIIVLCIYFALITFIYRIATKNSSNPISPILKKSVIILIIGCFFNQLMDLKSFSFGFWVIFGLTMRKQKLESPYLI
jgi:hypothetical protein